MRGCFVQTPDWIVDDKNDPKIIGISLGCDCVSEHEWGIRRLHEMLGVQTNAIGIEKLKIRNFQPLYRRKGMIHNMDSLIVILDSDLTANSYAKAYLKSMKDCCHYCDLYEPDKPGLYAAWDDSSFGILAVGKEFADDLEALMQGWEEQDMAIGHFSSSNPFSSGTLALMRPSLIPEEEKEAMKQRDEDQILLRKTAEDTHIQEILKQSGKEYFALAPRWATDEEAASTAYKVVFWLNPEDQQHVNYGWFTVEQLKQWANNEGPIPKS